MKYGFTQQTKVVAGPGFAPGAEGYEPPEILLLHPAIGNHFTTFFIFIPASIR